MEKLDNSVIDVMCNTFKRVQKSKIHHPKSIIFLRKLYKQTNFDEFYNAFIKCLKITLNHPEMNVEVENTLEFAAKFASRLTPVPVQAGNKKSTDDKNKDCPFLTKLFEFIFENHEAVDPGVRSRICSFIHLLLNSMKKNSWIDFGLHDRIMQIVGLRLIDESPLVRKQAVRALHNIQDSSDNECLVTELFTLLSRNDPSAEVRRTILTHIKKNRKTLVIALERIRDIDESVRKEAYSYLRKISMKSLTTINRQNVVKYGLNDTAAIREFVGENMLPAWLSTMNNNVLGFLDHLGSKSDVESGELALNALFNRMDINVLLKQLPLDPETKLIPRDELSCDKVLYWRCFAQHLHGLSYNHVLDCIIPDLTNFCDYIREILSSNAFKDYDEEEKMSRRYKVLQLFEIVKMYDLFDGVGRFHLKQLIGETLKSEVCNEKITESVMIINEKVVPHVIERMNMLTHIIKDIRWPAQSCKEVHTVKADPKTTARCLGIMCAMVQSPSIKSITQGMRTLLADLALPSVDHSDQEVQILSLKAVGICLLLDGDLAKLHFKKYHNILVVPKDNPGVLSMALTVVFDLLINFGLEHFNLTHQEDDLGQDYVDEMSSKTGAEQSSKSTIVMMMELIDNKEEKIRTSAAIGFCKLLLHGRMSSVQLVSRLIILWHDSETQLNAPLRHVLTCFFKQYPTETSGSQRVLEKAFIPILRNLCTAPTYSPLRKIRANEVANFVLRLTSHEFLKPEERNYTIHNNLALNILDEIADLDNEYKRDIFISCLQHVDVRIEDEETKSEILMKVQTLIDELQLSNEHLFECLCQFKMKLQGTVSKPALPA